MKACSARPATLRNTPTSTSGITARSTPSGRSTTALRVSGYRFLLRRVERALHGGRWATPRGAPLTLGWVLAAVAAAGCAGLAVLRLQADLDRARIVIARESGAWAQDVPKLAWAMSESGHNPEKVGSGIKLAGPMLVADNDTTDTSATDAA